MNDESLDSLIDVDILDQSLLKLQHGGGTIKIMPDL